MEKRLVFLIWVCLLALASRNKTSSMHAWDPSLRKLVVGFSPYLLWSKPNINDLVLPAIVTKERMCPMVATVRKTVEISQVYAAMRHMVSTYATEDGRVLRA
eukprot:1795907-Amphidinium_carterae.1